MDQEFLNRLQADAEALHSAGLFKAERVIRSPQRADITVGSNTVLNFCANNYLGLANHAELREAANGSGERAAEVVSVQLQNSEIG